MEPEVLAQHQVEEFRKLVGVYTKWRDDAWEQARKLAADPEADDMAFVCVSQTGTMLHAFITDANRILEQT